MGPSWSCRGSLRGKCWNGPWSQAGARPSPSILGTQICSNKGLQRMGVHGAGVNPQPQHGGGSEGRPPTQLLLPPMLTTVGLVGL